MSDSAASAASATSATSADSADSAASAASADRATIATSAASAASAASADEPTLVQAFWGVARQLRHQSRDSLAPWDVSPSHWRALATLGRHGAIRLNELSEHLHIAARSTTEVVDALEERDLARRRPDPHDRRATLVELTDHGREVNERIQASRAAESDAYFARLSAADRTELSRILATLQSEQPD